MKMKIALIRVNMHKHKSKDAMQPLFAAAIAAHTPSDFEVSLYDDRLEDIPFDSSFNLVALSIETYAAKRAYEIARTFRELGVKTIAGGFHPTLCTDECLQHCDSVFVGDVENSWSLVLDDLQKGKLQQIYASSKNTEGNTIQYDRRIFKNKNYGPVEMVQWSRGCPHDCDFCSIKAFYRGEQFCRPIADVIEEIKSLKKKIVFFVDDNLYFNKKKFKELVRQLIPLKIKWVCQISINIAYDEELLELMVQSGCIMVLIGIETFSKDNLKLMNKEWSISRMDTQKAIDIINSFGLNIYGTFVFGYDYDTRKNFEMALEFATKNRFFIANFNPLYPMPGTPLYERLKNENRLLHNEWWLDEDFYYGKTMFRPKHMTPEQLEQYCFETKKQFNSWKSIFSRSVNPLVKQRSTLSSFLYFYANIVNRRSILTKQGRKLG